MAIEYKVIRGINPKNKDEIYYKAAPVYKQKISLDHLCMVISESTLLTKADVEAILQAIISNCIIFVLNSTNVELGRLGRLVATISSEQSLTAEDFTKSHIRRVRMRLIPKSDFRKSLKNVEFKCIGTCEAETDDSGDQTA